MAGRTRRFGHAGILNNDSFVFYDHGTDSLWLQATGEAYFGPLQGRRLRLLPATVTTWAQWRARYPDTTVLPGRRLSVSTGGYDGPALPQYLGLAVVVRGGAGRPRAKLYPFDGLARRPLVHDVFAGTPLLVAYDGKRGTAAAWGRRVAGRVLTFRPARAGAGADLDATAPGHGAPGPPPRWRDRETGSVWDARTGEAVSGPLRGEALPLLTHHPIRTDRFRVFYPDSPVHGEEAP